MSVVLVTGSNGFVGRHLCAFLERRGHTVRRAIRSGSSEPGKVPGDTVTVSDIGSTTNWQAAVAGVDAVVHLAARAHVLDDRSPDPLAEFREVNTRGTVALARQAANAGVRRFVFVSSIKAGTGHTPDAPARESDPANPADPYGRSKHEAEQELFRIAEAGSMESVVVRPPLVYGPGVGANFLRLLKFVERGVPLPFLGVANRRSLVAVENLCDLIAVCMEHDSAGGEVFYVSDGADLSTPGLFQALGRAFDRPARLFRLPPVVLKILFRVLGRGDDYERLCGSLYVSIEKAQDLLGWTPPVAPNIAFRQTVAWYNDCHGTPEENM